MVTFIAYWKTKFQVCTCTFIEKFKLRRRNIFLAFEFVLERNERPKKKNYLCYTTHCLPAKVMFVKKSV